MREIIHIAITIEVNGEWLEDFLDRWAGAGTPVKRRRVASPKRLPQPVVKALPAGKPQSMRPSDVRKALRDTLLEVTGVDVVELAKKKVVSHPKWPIYTMSCARCGKSWQDGVAIARHHKIPTKLGKALGLSGIRLGEPCNMEPLCLDHHLEADNLVRLTIKERHPALYCWLDSEASQQS